MTHKFTLPTEAEMENLITQVYEGMLKPEQSRLSLIESKLLRESKKDKSQKKLNKIPWWLVLVLAGGFASATWWTGNLIIDRQNKEIIEEQTIPDDKIKGSSSARDDAELNTEGRKQNSDTYEYRDSPVIYQRESY